MHGEQTHYLPISKQTALTTTPGKLYKDNLLGSLLGLFAMVD